VEKITTDISTFEDLRRNGFVYVDKTDLLWRLVALKEGKQFFMARPRRFGKSLMIDTLRCIFEGRRELFKGLKIARKRYDWKRYPVVNLDMSRLAAGSPAELERNLIDLVDGLVRRFGLGKVSCPSSGRYLGNFFEALAARDGQFVVLIDEYDVPLQGFFGDRAALRRVRSILHDFYLQLKAHQGDIRFLMLTGVTKLTKVSVFSGLNQINDLTMEGAYAALLGYTRKEVAASFPKRIRALAKADGTDEKAALGKILHWYDSYRFSPASAVRVCNPISVGKALANLRIQGYWTRTAAATLVMERLEAARKTPDDFEGCVVSEGELDVCDAATLPVLPLMYQSGYLTIKGLSKSERDLDGNPKLVLGMPNCEVRNAMRSGWFDHYLKFPASEFDALLAVARRQLEAGDVRRLVGETLYRVYARVPPEWKIRTEADAKRHFRLFMEMLGATVQAEDGSAFGYADAILVTKRFVWIFEFKFNRSAASAIRQIRARGYADPYVAGGSADRTIGRSRGSSRPVTLVGINFSSRKRNIDEPVFESLREESGIASKEGRS